MNKLDLQRLKIERALQENKFDCLLPYPKLMFHWQGSHPQDVQGIARIASHRNRSLRHRLCGLKCQIIDRKMRKILVKLMIEALEKREAEYQQSLF